MKITHTQKSVLFKIFLSGILFSFIILSCNAPEEGASDATEEPILIDKNDTTNYIKTEVDNTDVDSIGDKF